MRALRWHGKHDIRCDTVPDPKIEHGRDAIIKVSTCAICGSDLHLFDGFMPTMKSGDIMGHEFMGEVVEVGEREQSAESRRPRGRAVHDLLRRMRPVQAREFLRLRAQQPQQGNGRQSVRPRDGRPLRLLASDGRLCRRTGGIRARSLRGHDACQDPRRSDGRAGAFPRRHLSDRLAGRGQCDIEPTDTVAIWGAGPVGQLAIRSAILLGAKQVVAIDRVPERLAMASAAGAITINFDDESVLDRLKELTGARGRKNVSTRSAWSRMRPARSMRCTTA